MFSLRISCMSTSFYIGILSLYAALANSVLSSSISTNFTTDQHAVVLSGLKRDSQLMNGILQKDFDGLCDYKKKQPRSVNLTFNGTTVLDKTYAVGHHAPFVSSWIERQFLFRVDTGKSINKEHFAASLFWIVENRLHHDGDKTWFEGGCSAGKPNGPVSAGFLLPGTQARYHMDKVTAFESQSQYRGEITRASASIRQWLAWYTPAGK